MVRTACDYRWIHKTWVLVPIDSPFSGGLGDYPRSVDAGGAVVSLRRICRGERRIAIRDLARLEMAQACPEPPTYVTTAHGSHGLGIR